MRLACGRVPALFQRGIGLNAESVDLDRCLNRLAEGLVGLYFD